MTPPAHRNRLDESARVKLLDDIRDRVRKKGGRVNWNAKAKKKQTAEYRSAEPQKAEVRSDVPDRKRNNTIRSSLRHSAVRHSIFCGSLFLRFGQGRILPECSAPARDAGRI
jgi:hypothetical protein